MPTKPPILRGGEAGDVRPPKSLGFLDIIGHSHITDVGATWPDHGVAHKIDGGLQPALFRSTALGGSVHSRHDQGNGAGGDGGWAHQLVEFDRQEQVTGFGASTLNATPSPNPGASSISVADRTNFYANEWIVVGAGANTEIVQISSGYVGATGAGSLTLTGTTAKSHASGDPVYHAVRNAGGYLPKSQLVIIMTGANDLPPLGPFAQGTFGTTAGASRGLQPFQDALRFTIAQMRCSVIYPSTHPSVILGAGFSNAGGQTNGYSYPTLYTFNGTVAFCTTTTNATITFSTDPDFPGGTVYAFFFSGTDGGGCNYTYAVSGATTVTSGTALIDTRNKQHVLFNNSGSSGGPASGTYYTGLVAKISGLNAGVNTVVITNAANAGVTNNGWFLGWGVEAQQPPLIYIFADPRPGSYSTWSSYPYYTRTTAGTATVSGLPATTVTVSSAYTVGTTGTSNAAVYPGDTVTIGTGASRETRRISSVSSTTVFVVDSAFLNTHSGDSYTIGLQNADTVGGGYENLADTQGATSVPGLLGAIRNVISGTTQGTFTPSPTTANQPTGGSAGFDRWVQLYNTDPIINPPGPGSTTISTTNFAGDKVHFSDMGHALLATDFLRIVRAQAESLQQMALPTVPNKRTYVPVFEAGGSNSYPTGQPTPGATIASLVISFSNGWNNFYPVNNAYPRTAFYKDMRTRMVTIRGAVTNLTALLPSSLPSAMFQLPVGYRPNYNKTIPAYGTLGPATVEIDPQGNVYVTAGYYTLTANATPAASTSGIVCFEGSYLAES
jgi:hypothetical protein